MNQTPQAAVSCTVRGVVLPALFGSSWLLPPQPNPNDVVYTPDDLAGELVRFWSPTGRILEPCKGDGAFMRHLPPETEWCEIAAGRDFFDCAGGFDWIVGNPPYSIFGKFLLRSMELSENVGYLIPTPKLLGSYKLMSAIYAWGGIARVMVIGPSRVWDYNIGFALGAFHLQRGYAGPMHVSFRDKPNAPAEARRSRSLQPDVGTLNQKGQTE